MSTTADFFQGASVASLNAAGVGRLPGLLGIEIAEVDGPRVRARLAVAPHHLAPNGYLHAATVIALADTACGYGCVANLPAGATGFTTVELKSNFVGTLLEGALQCRAEMVHGGRTTQLWDATVTSEGDGRLLALFRCTQLILQPRTPQSRTAP
jgi:1,4-dihydroxy-2-naphthoyl-CoA hydrolase